METELQESEISLNDSGKKFKIGYSDSKIGNKTVIFLHGFGSFIHTFDTLLPYLPANWRFLRLCLPPDGAYTIEEQSDILKNFILQKNLDSIILAGHSSGASVAVLAAADTKIASRIDKLVLKTPLIAAKKIPDFIKNIAVYNENNPLIRYASEDVFTYIFLKKAFFDERKITSTMIRSNADILKNAGEKEHLISFARNLDMASLRKVKNKLTGIKIPTLILWGAEDELFDIEDAYCCKEAIHSSELKIIPHCGHLLHEELPAETAAEITGFITSKAAFEPEKKKILFSGHKKQYDSLPMRHKMKLRKMVENWGIGTLTILIFMKLIQFLRFCGLRANENGWRKASGIFLQKEQSKFILGSFYLKYYREYQSVPFDLESAKAMFIHRISEFLRSKSMLHWSIEPKLFSLHRKRLNFNDIVEAEFATDGTLLKIVPYFDRTRKSFQALSQEHISGVLNEFIQYYNKLVHKKVNNIPRRMSRHLKTWIFKVRKLSFTGRFDMLELIERLMTASFINFEHLANNDLRKRLSTPNLKVYHHPGWGLLNMVVRFSNDFASADLWVQYHHVPVDGMPMQEILEELKKKWGTTQVLQYPALTSHEARPEVIYCGNSLFRGRFFADFSQILALRRQLNEKYSSEMSGPATLASMLMWGLCRHEFFRDAKILFPVDIAKGVKFANERELGLLFMRPDRFFNPSDELNGFLKYEKEFNMRLSRTRTCRSESYEMMELYSMVHPIFYCFAKNLMPKATSEYLGTVGLSMMRNAEMFLAPFSDLQKRGFMAIGNLSVPTIDGGKAGAVSICGSRKEIKAYIEALSDMTQNYNKYINM